MNQTLKKTLFWMARILAILFILFVSLFALDIFEMELGFWETIVGLFMHLLPSIGMTIALALGWRWEWVGTAFFATVGGWFLRISTPGDAMYYIVFVGVPFAISALSLLEWVYREQIRG